MAVSLRARRSAPARVSHAPQPVLSGTGRDHGTARAARSPHDRERGRDLHPIPDYPYNIDQSDRDSGEQSAWTRPPQCGAPGHRELDGVARPRQHGSRKRYATRETPAKRPRKHGEPPGASCPAWDTVTGMAGLAGQRSRVGTATVRCSRVRFAALVETWTIPPLPVAPAATKVRGTHDLSGERIP